MNRQQGRECGLAVVGGQQGVDRLFAGGLRQQGIVAGLFGGGGHLPCHHLVLHVGGLFGQCVLQSGLKGLHVVLLRLVQQAAQTVEVRGGRDACQRAVGCRAHRPVRGVQQREHLVGCGGDAPFCHEFQGVGLRGGRAVESCDERCVGLSVECRESCRGLFGMCASELCDERVERLLSSDFPGGADGGQGQFLVGRGNGRDHGVGLRCGVAGAEPAHDVGFRGVGERRHFLHDCGVEGVVGEIAGEVERRAAVFAVGVFQRGEQFRRLFFGVRAEDYSQTCGPDVLRHAGFAQGLGGGDGLAVSCSREPCEQGDVGARCVRFREGVSVGLCGCCERRDRGGCAALGQRVIDSHFRRRAGLGVCGPFQQRGLCGRKALLRGGIGQQGVRGRACVDQCEDLPVGSGRGDQSAHGVVGEVFVRGVFHEYGGFGRRCA